MSRVFGWPGEPPIGTWRVTIDRLGISCLPAQQIELSLSAPDLKHLHIFCFHSVADSNILEYVGIHGQDAPIDRSIEDRSLWEFCHVLDLSPADFFGYDNKQCAVLCVGAILDITVVRSNGANIIAHWRRIRESDQRYETTKEAHLKREIAEYKWDIMNAEHKIKQCKVSTLLPLEQEVARLNSMMKAAVQRLPGSL